MVPSVHLGCELVIAYGLTQVGDYFTHFSCTQEALSLCTLKRSNLKILLKTLKPKNIFFFVLHVSSPVCFSTTFATFSLPVCRMGQFGASDLVQQFWRDDRRTRFLKINGPNAMYVRFNEVNVIRLSTDMS